MRRKHSRIEVYRRGGRLHAVRHNGRHRRILEVVDRWVVQGRWWSKEEKRIFYRVRTGDGVMEIYRSGKIWRLSKIID